MFGNETAREKNLLGKDRLADTFRIFQNPCLGSFRYFWHQLFTPYQRSPPRRTACPGHELRQTCQDDAEHRHVQCCHCYGSWTAEAGEVSELPQQELPGLICQHPAALAGQRQLSLLQHFKDIATQLSARPFDPLAGPWQPTSVPTPQLLQLSLPTSTEGVVDQKTGRHQKNSRSSVYLVYQKFI